MNVPDKMQISAELSRLIALQTSFIKRAIRRQMKFEDLNGRADAPANCLLNWRS